MQMGESVQGSGFETLVCIECCVFSIVQAEVLYYYTRIIEPEYVIDVHHCHFLLQIRTHIQF